MPQLVDVATLPTDRFGFTIYGVMAHLPERQANEIYRFHELIGADDFATKPHCSLDNFWGPPDLDAVKNAVGEVARSSAPFETEVDFSDTRIAEWGCAFTLKGTPGLISAQQKLLAALVPLTQRIFPADHPYWPHTSGISSTKPEEMPRIEPSLEKIDVSGVMRFETIELIGRVGPSRGGEYHVLESFPLAGD